MASDLVFRITADEFFLKIDFNSAVNLANRDALLHDCALSKFAAMSHVVLHTALILFVACIEYLI